MERDQYPFGFGTITGVGRPRRAGYARYSDAVPFRPLAVTISRSTATAVRPAGEGWQSAGACAARAGRKSNLLHPE